MHAFRLSCSRTQKFIWFKVIHTLPFKHSNSYPPTRVTSDCCVETWPVLQCKGIWNISGGSKKKLAASSMLHEAKIAYYAFDVILYCMYTHQTRIAYTKRTHWIAYTKRIRRHIVCNWPAVAKATWRHCLSHFIDREAARTYWCHGFLSFLVTLVDGVRGQA